MERLPGHSDALQEPGLQWDSQQQEISEDPTPVCCSCEPTDVQGKRAGRQSPRNAARLELQEAMALLAMERRNTAAP